ncbi:CRISPR-associated endonuclease Cas3'' [Segnochrobactraceae bacterium EtOH-i3]
MAAGPCFAHSVPDMPEALWEPLGRHLEAVGDTAARFAAPFHVAELARVAGRLHDLGKLAPEFQAYIRGERPRGVDHSSAGAAFALDHWAPVLARPMAAAIAGHHAGLADGPALTERLTLWRRDNPQLPAGWQDLVGTPPDARALAPRGLVPDRETAGFSFFFLTRMLFSCLTDADFLETERFYADADGRAVARGGHTPLPELRDRVFAHLAELRAQAPDTPVNRIRAEVLDAVLAKAGLSPGPFTLTVPTGGGKTLASLAFALDHAVRHGLKRVIYVIPYTSIIEQTAGIFRTILGDADVLEHHASFDWDRTRDRNDGADGLAKLRRAAENWDVPVVVTTAVQFFESLFANRPARCRKLHNIAESVVILDEVQTLPVGLVRPCLVALAELSRNYRVSPVLCTATQPAFRKQDGLKGGLDIPGERELAPDPAGLYRRLKRVSVERLPDPVGDEAIATRFADADQMLVIVNSRAHARGLYERIRALPGAVHLSTLMCPAHRRQVLAGIRTRLAEGLLVRLVATSLIEAGVDVDFPEVWRAAAGLDQIAQAAGRCNREGRRTEGRVVVFEPAEAKPPHDLKVRFQAAGPVFRSGQEIIGLPAIQSFFRALYWQKGPAALDDTRLEIGGAEKAGVLPAIAERAGSQEFPFAEIAAKVHLIDDFNEPVVVPWRAHPEDDAAEKLMARIAAMEKPLAADLRALQSYIVPVPPRDRGVWLTAGVLRPLHPALGDTILRFGGLDYYDADCGVRLDGDNLRSPGVNIIS